MNALERAPMCFALQACCALAELIELIEAILPAPGYFGRWLVDMLQAQESL